MSGRRAEAPAATAVKHLVKRDHATGKRTVLGQGAQDTRWCRPRPLAIQAPAGRPPRPLLKRLLAHTPWPRHALPPPSHTLALQALVPAGAAVRRPQGLLSGMAQQQAPQGRAQARVCRAHTAPLHVYRARPAGCEPAEGGWPSQHSSGRGALRHKAVRWEGWERSLWHAGGAAAGSGLATRRWHFIGSIG
jgi:hypothetical protein